MRIWWCNSHERMATFRQGTKYICDPKLGGITLPCFTVNLTGQVEIVDDISPEITRSFPPTENQVDSPQP